VVLPDPPFCDAIARTRMLFPSPNELSAMEVALKALKSG
jgi:hypothetical protein